MYSMNAETIDISQLRQAAGAACSTLRLLANEDRLMLLCQISQGEKNVSTLESLTGIRQPTLSQQLGVLRTEGVVSTRREGKQIFYSLSDPHIEDLLQTLYNLYCCENCKS
jgi:DNA-binding transcriptional ArsR family regulator